MDPALETYLRRPALPRFLAAPHDFFMRHQVRRAAQGRGQLPLRERAEAAAEVTDIRVLDVASDDIADLVAAHLSPETVRSSKHPVPFVAAGAEETCDLLLPELGAGVDRQRVTREERDRHVFARRPIVFTRQPQRVRGAQDRRHDARVDPFGGDPLGIDGQASRQLQPTALGGRAQPVELGPGRLGVHVIDRHGRDAAPVVDPGVEQARKVVVGKIRRRLEMRVRTEQDASDGDRPEQLVQFRLRRVRHPRPGLCPEVLDDHFLDVAVALGKLANREQRFDALRARFADADEEPGREGHPFFSRGRSRLETAVGELVRRAEVRTSALGKARRGRLQHEAHRRADAPKLADIVPRHHAGVEMWQEACLYEHCLRRPSQVFESRLAPQRLKLLARNPVAQLRLVPEGEQRFATTYGDTGASDVENLVDAQIRPRASARRPSERAVVTHVAAELRERDEDLRRVRDEPAVPLRAQRPRFRTELVERPGEELHQWSLDPDAGATETQKSIEATPSAVATSTAATPAAAIDQRRAGVPGAAMMAAPPRPSVTPTNVSTAWKANPSARAAPRPTPVPCRASVAAPAPAPKFPGVRGSRPASAIAANRTTATQIGWATPSAIAIATAAATRATHEHPIQPNRAAPSRGERPMERKIWSRLPIRPAVLALRRVPTASTTTTPRASKGAGQRGIRPTVAAGTISAARTSVRAAATEAAIPPARQSRSSPGRVRESSPSRTAPPRCAGAREFTSEPIVYRAEIWVRHALPPHARSPTRQPAAEARRPTAKKDAAATSQPGCARPRSATALLNVPRPKRVTPIAKLAARKRPAPNA